MERRVTLTFDNGPTPDVTESVLETLAAHRTLSTFFVVGADLRREGARELVRRAAAEGHWIGNHTMTHTTQLGDLQEPGAAEREISEAQRELGELGHPDRLFRPFAGGGVLSRRLLSREAVDVLRRGAYTCVLWNSVPRDWEDPAGWVDRCLADVAGRDWSLVVLHDTPTGAMSHLDAFLSGLEERGLVTTQAFPDACVPVRHGVVQLPLDQLMD